MATLTVTKSPGVVTMPGDTDTHILNVDAILKGSSAPIDGVLTVQWLSGTSVQFDAFGGAITSESGALTEAIGKLILPVALGRTLNVKGGAGGETFQVSVI